MTTWELKDLQDLPIVSNAEAREIGRVEEVLFNPGANALFGLIVMPAEKDSPKLFIPLSGIRSIGSDAITVESLIVAEPLADNAQAQAIAEADGNRSGMSVMTESGELVGKIDKVTIQEDGTVVSYHSTTGLFGTKHDIEPSEVRSGSENMLIISDGAREGPVKSVTA
ncbi:MAG TPA: PRC-barrel domain-containing protein [Dehalococcoidia bacterium]|nr:PRC-barrel domain-containing protein [Dehalococcoidia bacterium]